MFREMRRKKQLLSEAESLAVLQRGTSGVLAVAGDQGYPYAVPLSYVCHDSKIYFHCARAGHKLEAIAREPKVSFCVIDTDQVAPAEFTTYFRSVIAFGRARVLDDQAEKRRTLEILAKRYSPDNDEARQKEIESQFNQLHMIELVIDHLTGKESIEFVRAKEAGK